MAEPGGATVKDSLTVRIGAATIRRFRTVQPVHGHYAVGTDVPGKGAE
ncbi:hypothetical protein GCM10022202_30530 [Microbacterium marinilacus]|uniref:Uncharacterized protein n=1 Tax=Microbacterium marinilacus TaxID=415209 RepID=A0ABP7BP49_9MICO